MENSNTNINIEREKILAYTYPFFIKSLPPFSLINLYYQFKTLSLSDKISLLTLPLAEVIEGAPLAANIGINSIEYFISEINNGKRKAFLDLDGGAIIDILMPTSKPYLKSFIKFALSNITVKSETMINESNVSTIPAYDTKVKTPYTKRSQEFIYNDLDRFKTNYKNQKTGSDNTGTSNSSVVAGMYLMPTPPPMIMLNPLFTELLEEGYDATSVINNLFYDNSSSLSDAETGMINAKNAYFASLYDDGGSFWDSWFGRILGNIINYYIDTIIDSMINNINDGISVFLTGTLGPSGEIISPIAEEYVDTKIKEVTNALHV